MRVLTIVHQRDAGPGVFAEAANAAGHELVEWMPPEAPPPAELEVFDAVLILGGAMNVGDDLPWLQPEKAALKELVEQGTPIFGACLGAQLLVEASGGQVRRAVRPEIGWFDVQLTDTAAKDPLLGRFAPGFEAFGWHSYEFLPPPGATVLAASEVCTQAARVGGRSWAIQFHAEVDRPTVQRWMEHRDEDADAADIDPEALWAETEPKLAAWNDLGRELFGRWLRLAG